MALRSYKSFGIIKSDQQFKDWLENYCKQNHPNDYNQDIVDDMFKNLTKRYAGDYGAMIGAAKGGGRHSYAYYAQKYEDQNPNRHKTFKDSDADEFTSELDKFESENVVFALKKIRNYCIGRDQVRAFNKLVKSFSVK